MYSPFKILNYIAYVIINDNDNSNDDDNDDSNNRCDNDDNKLSYD